jgi:hypothetical protein
MTVRVEVDSSGGKLIRSDGVSVECEVQGNESMESFQIFGPDREFWGSLECGPFQELEVGPSPRNAGTLLLMGHYRDGYCSAVVTLDGNGLSYEGVVTGPPTAKRMVGSMILANQAEKFIHFHAINMGAESSQPALIGKADVGHFTIVASTTDKKTSEKSHFSFRLTLPRQ